MFYRGEAVKSIHHGLGWVVRTSENPCVRFLDNRECWVESRSLTIIPADWIDDEIQNRRRWEDWLDWRVYRIRRSGRPLLKPPQFDLEMAMTEAGSMPLGGFKAAATDTVGYGFVEHIVRDAAVLPADGTQYLSRG